MELIGIKKVIKTWESITGKKNYNLTLDSVTTKMSICTNMKYPLYYNRRGEGGAGSDCPIIFNSSYSSETEGKSINARQPNPFKYL